MNQAVVNADKNHPAKSMDKFLRGQLVQAGIQAKKLAPAENLRRGHCFQPAKR